jgi:non-ribosomal peptide synthase protein (TIGR01720 family)
VKLERMPLTPNGKLDRKALPRAEGESRGTEQYVGPRTEVERTLADIWALTLRRDRVGVQENFFELGGDSILSIQIVARARQAGIAITVRDMFQHQTIAELARVAGNKPRPSEQTPAPQGRLSGPVEWTPIQQWFFEQERHNPSHYNQAALLKPARPLEAGALAQAVGAILDRHDMLRLRVEAGAGRLLERETASVLVCVDLRELEEDGCAGAVATVVEELQRSLDLGGGPVVRLGWIREKRGERLLWVAHHLSVDGVSWRILVEDLERAYKAATEGGRIELGPKTTAYGQWAEELKRYGASARVEAEASHWLEVAEAETVALPIDQAEGLNLVGTAEVVESELCAEETGRLVEELAKRYEVGLREGLLSGLAEAVSEWSGQGRIKLEVEGHGREEVVEGVDLSRTVGWFTSLYPVILEAGVGTAGERLRRVKRDLERAPANGIGYGLLRYGPVKNGELGSLARRLRSAARPEILFNYLGDFDAVFRADAFFAYANEMPGATQSDSELRLYDIEITSFVLNGRLRVEWKYCKGRLHREIVERLSARAFTKLLSYLEEQPEILGLNEFELSEEELSLALESVSADFQ